MNARAGLSALFLCLLACVPPNPPEVPPDAGPAADAGLDAADAGTCAGCPELRPGDLLLTDNRVVFGPGFLACVEGFLQHADGTREPLPAAALEATTEDPAVARLHPSPAGCEGAALLALGMGTTTTHLRYARGGRTLLASVPVIVTDVEISQLTLRNVRPIGAGYATRFPSAPGAAPGDATVSNAAKLSCKCEVAWSEVELTTGDASVATVRRVAPRSWELRGVAQGTTTLGGRLALPGRAPIPVVEAPLPVGGAGTLQGLFALALFEEEELVFQGTRFESRRQGALPDRCYAGAAMGAYSDGKVSWSSALTAGVTWRSSNEQAVVDTAGRVCFGHGDIRLDACAQGFCTNVHFPLWAEGDVRALVAQMGSAGDVQQVAGPWSEGALVVCPPSRLAAELTDGGSYPLTASANVQWKAELADGGAVPAAARAALPDGGLLDDPNGNPCFRWGFLAGPTPVRFRASYWPLPSPAPALSATIDATLLPL